MKKNHKKNRYVFIPKKHIRGVSFVRISKMLNEFVEGFKFLTKYNKIITIFGSSRARKGTTYYKEALNLASLLSKKGYTIATGGGGGVMEAANKGAYLAGGNSIGLNIDLPEEQGLNKYLTDSISFRYFFIRKIMLTFASEAYIFFPGGFGTLDEFFEIITLIQTKKLKKIPVILVHAHYWKPLISWMKDMLHKKKKTVNKQDLKIFKLVHTVEEALKTLN